MLAFRRLSNLQVINKKSIFLLYSKVLFSFSEPISRIFSLLTDCTRYKEWWPKTYSYEIQKCVSDGVGTEISFHSTVGSYLSHVSEIQPNKEMKVNYIKYFLILFFFFIKYYFIRGIFGGSTTWKLRETPEGTELCFITDMQPKGKRLRLVQQFMTVDSAYVGSYYTPLLDNLKNYITETNELKDLQEWEMNESLFERQSIQASRCSSTPSTSQTSNPLSNQELNNSSASKRHLAYTEIPDPFLS